jgi:endonuclease YncB( thermonuclease family)
LALRRAPLRLATLVPVMLFAACSMGGVVAAPSAGAHGSPPSTSPTTARPGAAHPSSPDGFVSAPPAPTGRTENARVVRVVDGDTIVVDRGRGNEKLRYIGMDTPETVAPGQPVEWMGPEASAANKRLVAGHDVVLERDVSETDRYGRLLRYVWTHDAGRWSLVNLELVQEGYAQVSTYPPDVKYVDVFLAAQRSAREAGLGLWSDSAPAR